MYIICFRIVFAGCGGTFGGRQGVITSPNYPSNYPNRANCVYDVTVPAGFVCFTFTLFETETGYDYVRFYDGQTNTQFRR